jgi:hypothetical protein
MHDEVPESADFDLLLTFQHLFDDFKYLRYDFRRFFGPQTDLPLNNVYKIDFRHNAPIEMHLDKRDQSYFCIFPLKNPISSPEMGTMRIKKNHTSSWLPKVGDTYG